MDTFRKPLMFFLAIVSGSLGVSWAQSSPPAASKPNSYTVAYTSRLFGYFRYPEVQEIHLGQVTKPGCDGQTPLTDQSNEKEAYRFQQLARPLQRDALVSTGDNFAPFLLGREALVFQVPNNQGVTPSPEIDGKDKYDYDGSQWVEGVLHNSNGTIPMDNVACFLRRMHFDAIVPGIHDFYFGPERLRQLAKLLAKPDDENCPEARRTTLPLGLGDCPVAMLGANLFIKTSPGRPSSNPPPPNSPFRLSAPTLVTPWMRRIMITASGTGVLEKPPAALLQDCDPNKVIALHFLEQRYKTLVYEIPADAKGLNVNSKQVLIPDHKYCVQVGIPLIPAGDFTVAFPFFSNSSPAYPASKTPPSNPFEPMWPWVDVTLHNQQHLVIFGVVDQKIAEAVGRLNYTWLGLKKNQQGQDKVSSEYESTVAVSDPAEALNQVLEYCAQLPQCNQAHKLVLAQMHEAVAHQELGFVRRPIQSDMTPLELLITDADTDRATGQRTSTLSNNPKNGDKAWFRPTVLVPGTHFQTIPSESPYDVTVRLQAAVVAVEPNSRTVQNQVFIDDPANKIPADPLGERKELICKTQPCATTLTSELNNAMKRNPSLFQRAAANNAKEALQIAQELALETMRRVCQSDVALLQQRDIFSADDRLFSVGLTQAGVKAAIKALFWKGDFIQCLNLPGDTLQSIMKRSGELKSQEEAGLVTELSYGWWLLAAGIEPASNFQQTGPAKILMVNGDFLAGKDKLYSVAATDYLANGDTGYPVLHGSEPDPQVPLTRLKVYDLTEEIITTAIVPGKSRGFTAEEALDRLDRSGLFQQPKTPTTLAGWLGSWGHNEALSSSPGSFERYQQQHSIFSLKLYKLDFSYSIFQHNGTENSVPLRFPGVTSFDLSGTGSFEYAADYQIRAERSAPRFTWYFESDMNFGRKNKRANFKPPGAPCLPGILLDTCYQASQTANYWYQEGGLALRITPGHQNPSGLKLIFPVGLKTQVVRPYTQIASLLPAPKGAPSITGPSLVSAPRNYYLSFRPGLRYDHSYPRGAASPTAPKTKVSGPSPGKTFNSYVEAGFETGEVFNSVGAYQFLGISGNSASGTCQQTGGLVPVRFLTGCLTDGTINSGTPLSSVQGGRNFSQHGLYLNFRFDMPLPVKSNPEYVVENRGDYFFRRSTDVAVDTRFLDDLSTSLIFPIIGKLGVGPAAELIFFETKGPVPGNYYFSYSTALAVNYNFDWRPGLKKSKAALFGNSDPAPQPLSSR